jgi:hypothetical protein
VAAPVGLFFGRPALSFAIGGMRGDASSREVVVAQVATAV